ncbi:MAG: M48 family metallopeptidase [Candidatus Omnitrophica bacterium]|nr:M48 family metallopeptidase [Candidatus Omnitrophota bacterium]
MDRGKAYQKKKHIASLFSLAVTIVSLAVFILTPLSICLRAFSQNHFENPWIGVAVYFSLFSVILFFIDLPLTYYSGFHIEHEYALSNLTIRGWVRETAKRQMIGFAFAVILVEMLYAIIRRWPDGWWIIAWLAWALVSVAMSRLWPVFIAPIFNKYERLSNEELRRCILDLVNQVNLKIENVYSMNLSKTTNKANAFFQGLGSTRRVVLSDTLLRSFTPEEITVVVAHEAGHCKHRHIVKEIIFGFAASFLIFWLAYRCLAAFAGPLGIESAADVAGFPLLCLVAVIFGLISMPLGNFYSRMLEREADEFALKSTKMKTAFISAMKKLSLLNLADPEPHPLIEFLLYSHPSIRNRIKHAEAFAR